MSRKLVLVSENISNLLIKQLAHELKNYNLYRSFQNYYDVEGCVDLAEYYSKRADEELLHHKWISDYLNEGDVKFMYPAVEQNSEKPTDYVMPFRATVDREIQTTQMIYAIYEAAMAEKDYMTASWLYEKLIKEQIEEENTSRMALTIMEEESGIYSRAHKVLDLLEK